MYDGSVCVIQSPLLLELSYSIATHFSVLGVCVHPHVCDVLASPNDDTGLK